MQKDVDIETARETKSCHKFWHSWQKVRQTTKWIHPISSSMVPIKYTKLGTGGDCLKYSKTMNQLFQ